jgi:hypothetical protein
MGNLILALLSACILHEGGHYAAALAFGKRITFHFLWAWIKEKIPIPRFIWAMPHMERWKQRVVALAGFGVELIFVPIFICAAGDFAFWYSVAVAAHFILYPLYAGEDSDFKWVI